MRHSKRNEPECANQRKYRCVCNKRVVPTPVRSFCSATTQGLNTIAALLKKFKWEVIGHPSYSPDLSPCDYVIFGPLEKALRGQKIHLGRRRQAVSAELVHIEAPGILRDSHSPPCIAVGHLLQLLGQLLLTYRYRFLFLGLQIVSFLMPLILTNVTYQKR